MHVGSQQMMPQPINPPQYIRPGTAQVMSPMSLAGVNQQINQGKFIQQQQQRFHQPSQPRGFHFHYVILKTTSIKWECNKIINSWVQWEFRNIIKCAIMMFI